tara:strand:- start:992 stop:1327 length:336 start_codon:yes stop_codon:yes gene_type:complete
MIKEKTIHFIYPIIILVFGWSYYFIITYLNYIDFESQFIDGILAPFARKGKYDTILFKLIAIGFGVIGLYLSYKSKTLNQKKIRVLLILLSLLLLIMSIVAFPNLIWYYLI